MLKQSNLAEGLNAYLNGDQNVHIVFNKYGNQTYMKLSELLDCISICFVDKDNQCAGEDKKQNTILPEKCKVDENERGATDTTITPHEVKENNEDKIAVELVRDGKSWVTPSLTTKEEQRRLKQSRKLKIDLGKMFALKQAGWTRAQVADDLDVSYQTVLKYWNKEKEYLAGEL